MALRILLASEGPRLGPEDVLRRPTGGVETAFALLAAALRRAGHDLAVLAGDAPAGAAGGLDWKPLPAGGDLGAFDLAIVNRVPRLFRALPPARRRVLWLHNPAGYLRKPRHLLPLLRARPVLVTLGPHHSATLPPWLPRWWTGGRAEIPLALAPPFDAAFPRRDPPPPVAVFAANPLRGLDWLLDVWRRRIQPAVPGAVLRLYTGAGTYGGDVRLTARAAPVLAEARATPGVELPGPLPRRALAEAYAAARVMLYRGDAGETFCLALAEAQAAGLPAVVTDLGAVAERVADGVTGHVAADAEGFARAAIRLLTEDAAWTAAHHACLARGAGPGWDAVAARFVALAGNGSA